MRTHSLTFLLTLISASYLKSLPALAADENASPEADSTQSEKPKKKAKKAPEEAPPSNENAAKTDDTEKAPSGEALPTHNVEVARSATSIALDERLSFGTGLGWAYVKPATGKWEGIGASTLFGSWRKSPKPDGSLFITGSYTPYAGTWLVDERYYNTTVHAFMGGASWLLPFSAGKAEVKAGVELGYLMVYAIPQDRVDADGKVKAGKFGAGGNVEMNWTVLNKVKIGPMARFSAGGFTTAFVGAAARFVF